MVGFGSKRLQTEPRVESLSPGRSRIGARAKRARYGRVLAVVVDRPVARRKGLEIALGFAIQCSPDHPRIRELCEATSPRGREEYFGSEKREIQAWGWDRPVGGAPAPIEVEELLRGDCVAWRRRTQRIRLDPDVNPCAIWRVATTEA
jgi:hypothetical protein